MTWMLRIHRGTHSLAAARHPHEELNSHRGPTAKTAKTPPPAAGAAIGVRPDEALTTREKQDRSGFWFGAARKMPREGA